MAGIIAWLARAEAKLDEWGRGAWIIAMILGFIAFWPIGLAFLGYMLWSGRMGCSKKRSYWAGWSRNAEGSGNVAFDEYREQTLRRLEEEQEAFGDFLGHLRKAKDKAEFDQFMEERRRGAASGGEMEPAR